MAKSLYFCVYYTIRHQAAFVIPELYATLPHEGLLCAHLMLFFFLSGPQPQELTDVLEISNMVFTSLFSLEMLLKVLALGIFGYIKNPYNSFDSVIVIIRFVYFFWFVHMQVCKPQLSLHVLFREKTFILATPPKKP